MKFFIPAKFGTLVKTKLFENVKFTFYALVVLLNAFCYAPYATDMLSPEDEQNILHLRDYKGHNEFKEVQNLQLVFIEVHVALILHAVKSRVRHLV